MLKKVMEGVHTVAVSGHLRPDGDCVGSTTAMYLYLKKCYKNVQVDLYLDEVPDVFREIKGVGDILHKKKDVAYDLFIALDCGDKERLGFAEEIFDRARKTFSIDHHVSNRNYGDENYVLPDASSTCELCYNLFDKEEIDRDIARSIYLGLVHDTGVFQYSNVSRSTFEAAAFLITKDIDAPALIDETYYKKTYSQNQIMARTLLESFLLLDGKVIVGSVSKEVLKFYNVTTKDLDGIVNQLRNTKGVEVALFMYELEDGIYKASLRSNKEVDVNAIAGLYGGGGHIRAAGFSMPGTAHDIANNVAREVEMQLNRIR
ncbi:phosphoesterase RecJ-like protein [Aequitasia blattaphilus]|uniref:Bifunctional oligoribonuclease/PAP phosphatase NrnA n=1 Tax=Aequitasia blattaphilus TaxID=2949332 RepID=A0ABT1E634_9FIRM|nr:bifunctional oligoribonuclease/PAP phosphatase NrnA [Aequitasia blattaphilus]MCP1101171.1 bifunctional oligoribonuclease/PAP phosphatase NrnA [Aequitasia blattaphilus]MCR8613811.1 bifunctional oligoribonuclease/PAP phosphatase NrnA [Aequitasia blattaphilus]